VKCVDANKLNGEIRETARHILTAVASPLFIDGLCIAGVVRAAWEKYIASRSGRIAAIAQRVRIRFAKVIFTPSAKFDVADALWF
jgi:hypothetical protein